MTQNYQAAQSLKKKTSRKDLKAIQVFTGYFGLRDRVDFDGQAHAPHYVAYRSYSLCPEWRPQW